MEGLKVEKMVEDCKGVVVKVLVVLVKVVAVAEEVVVRVV